ncbi:MAG TPA: glutathione S-transferase family protein [Rhodospirillaceae bacterium]|nr:glutathione S-transferase family protein [Rhodospirillaceae bacterium]
MIKLFGFIPAWGLPDISPYVSKTDLYLRLAGVPFSLEMLYHGDLTQTSKGKLPFIDDNGTIVSDTVLIEMYIKNKFGDRLDAGLTAAEKAISVAFARMGDWSFYWFLVQMRYRRDEDFKIYDPFWVEFLSWLPVEQRAQPVKEFRERLLLQFFHSGMGRNSEAEVEQLAYQQIDAISDFLADKPYFHGDKATSVDSAIYANLSHCMFVPFPSPIGKYANGKPNLLAYVNRIQQQHYMQYDAKRAVRGPT